MMDFFFFVKTFLLTILVVLVMQIQVDNKSIETHALSWVQTSAVTAPLNSVATGGSKFIRDMTNMVSNKIHGRKEPSKAKKEEVRSSFKWLWEKKSDHDQDIEVEAGSN